MGRITKIDWCDSTWSPVTGCLHGCKYCYARRIAERFDGKLAAENKHIYELYKPVRSELPYDYKAYPYGFEPTFHRYKLNEPQRWKKPRTIFVCSMADLFGDWVPEEWIREVMGACQAAPQHRYIFLTKNPKRLLELPGDVLPKQGFWYGATIECPATFGDALALEHMHKDGYNTFYSIEPMIGEFPYMMARWMLTDKVGWVILGAETGNRKAKVIPEKEWIDTMVEAAREQDVPVFMKESLRGIMGDGFVQEFPWEGLHG